MILADVDGVAASRPGRPLFAGVSFTIASGDRLGVVGLNGCGKSTLLRILAGGADPEAGTVRRGRDARVVVLDQAPVLPTGTVRDALGPSWEAAAVADRLGMTPHLDADVATLSGGQAKRVALARALVAIGADGTDDVLAILDEPTNHLDIDAIAWLEDRLARFRGGLVLVTHDRHLLDRLTTRVLELDRGRAFLHVPLGEHAGSGYAAYLAARAEREELAARDEATRRNLARAELAWLRRGAPARRRKPRSRIEGARAVIEARPQAPARAGELDLSMGTSRLGSKVLELHGLGHRWAPAGPWLFRGLDHLLEPGDRLGLVGANGTGKSTLLDVLAGVVTPAEGYVEAGSTVRVGYYDQHGAALDPEARVLDVIAGPTKVAGPDEMRLAERFWFDRDAQHAPVGRLSGGERRRLQLLVVLAARPNVLLLDEPTNDLDLDTLRVLEDFCEGFAGVVVVASHDRAFLERVVEEVVVFDGAGHAGFVPGGYEAYEAERRARRGGSGGNAPSGARADAGPGGDTRVRRHPAHRSPSTVERLLGKADTRLSRAQARRDALHAEMAAVAADHVALARLAHDLAAVEAEVSAAEEEWLALAAELDEARQGR